MNAAALFRLFKPFHWVLVALLSPLLILLLVFTHEIKNSVAHPGLVFFALLIPPAFLGASLALTAAEALRRPAMALLPGLQESLLRLNVGLAIGLSAVWAFFTAPMGIAPLWARIAICVAAATTTLPFGARLGRSHLNVLIILFYGGYVAGASVRTSEFLRTLIDAARNHPALLGIAAITLAAWNIARALDRNRLRRAELTQLRAPELPPRHRSWLGQLWAGEGSAEFRKRDGSPQRVRSILADESPRPGYNWAIVAICASLLLIIPHYGTGYPTGWYTFIFDRGVDRGTLLGSMVASLALFSMGCFVPRLRSHQLYPVSRRRRAAADFAHTIRTLALLLSTWILAPIAAGAIVGWAMALPVDLTYAAREFALPALMAVPAVAVVRSGVYHLEERHEISLMLVAIGSLVGMVIGWIVVEDMPIPAALIVTLTAAALGLAILWAAISLFYRKGDLVWPARRRKPTAINL